MEKKHVPDHFISSVINKIYGVLHHNSSKKVSKADFESILNRGPVKIGILGAGIAGLYAALIIEELNKTIRNEEDKIDYKILEKDDRVGGRLFTHHFTSAS